MTDARPATATSRRSLPDLLRQLRFHDAVAPSAYAADLDDLSWRDSPQVAARLVLTFAILLAAMLAGIMGLILGAILPALSAWTVVAVGLTAFTVRFDLLKMRMFNLPIASVLMALLLGVGMITRGAAIVWGLDAATGGWTTFAFLCLEVGPALAFFSAMTRLRAKRLGDVRAIARPMVIVAFGVALSAVPALYVGFDVLHEITTYSL